MPCRAFSSAPSSPGSLSNQFLQPTIISSAANHTSGAVCATRSRISGYDAKNVAPTCDFCALSRGHLARIALNFQDLRRITPSPLPQTRRSQVPVDTQAPGSGSVPACFDGQARGTTDPRKGGPISRRLFGNYSVSRSAVHLGRVFSASTGTCLLWSSLV